MRTMGRTALAVAMLGAAAIPAAAQSLEQRIRQAGDGTVRLSYASRPDLCGNGRTIIGSRSHRDEWEGDCERGPVRVALEIANGRMRDVRTYVGGRWRPAAGDVTDLGTVSASEAATTFLALAERGGDEDLVAAATFADSVETWPMLLRVARSAAAPRDTRRAAVFWLGQAAGGAVTPALDSMVADDRGDREVREAAIFALSQRPREEGVPALIRIARTNADPRLRRKALFWLGESDDPRALALFEELLLGRR